MRNVTFSVDEHSLELARERAARENRSLNDVIRKCLDDYALAEERVLRFREIMKSLKHVRLSAPVSREELNRRR